MKTDLIFFFVLVILGLVIGFFIPLPKLDAFVVAGQTTGIVTVPVSTDKFTLNPSVPTKLDYYCGVIAYAPLCSMFKDLVALNNASVDLILKKLPGFTLVDPTGAVVFPRTP